MKTILTGAPTTSKKGAISMLGHNLRKEAGQALVELALVVPVFTVLLIGAAEFGRLAYADIEVCNAARAGAAYASQNHVTADTTDATNLANINKAVTQDAPNVGGITATVTDTFTNTTPSPPRNAGTNSLTSSSPTRPSCPRKVALNPTGVSPFRPSAAKSSSWTTWPSTSRRPAALALSYLRASSSRARALTKTCEKCSSKTLSSLSSPSRQAASIPTLG